MNNDLGYSGSSEGLRSEDSLLAHFWDALIIDRGRCELLPVPPLIAVWVVDKIISDPAVQPFLSFAAKEPVDAIRLHDFLCQSIHLHEPSRYLA